MSDPVSPIIEKTNVTLTCIVHVEIGPSVRELDLALSTLQWMLNVQLFKPGGNSLQLAPTGLPINLNGKTFTYTASLSSFMRTDSGNYSCIANLSSLNPPYFTLAGNISDTISVTTGKNYCYSRACIIYRVCIL